MTSEEFRKAWKREPFRAFRLRMSSGAVLLVTHPDFVAHPPGSRTATIYDVREGGFEIVDLLLVEGLSFEEQPPMSESGEAA